MSRKCFTLTMMAVLILTTFSMRAEDLRKIASLSGYWRFTIGDDISWANPAYDDSKWDQIAVPGKWENQGYDDYNGYAWYRKEVMVGSLPANTTIYMVLGRIDDVDEVYLNGKLLGGNGSFPPTYITAYDRERKYVIPKGYLQENGENVVAVRVYDGYLEGGILGGQIGLYVDSDLELLDLNLTGRWKFNTGDNKEWKAPDYNDEKWKRLNVPGDWDNQGYFDYDGYAWYRVKFKVPQDFMKGEFYLSLGKIDDIDDVYLNGKYIGSVYDLKHSREYHHGGWEYNARRIYKINSKMLNYGGINTLAIRVNDLQQRGGIYEGPIGIMSPENCRRYQNKHYSDHSFWDFIYDKFVIEY
jgi:hypothetical protein